MSVKDVRDDILNQIVRAIGQDAVAVVAEDWQTAMADTRSPEGSGASKPFNKNHPAHPDYVIPGKGLKDVGPEVEDIAPRQLDLFEDVRSLQINPEIARDYSIPGLGTVRYHDDGRTSIGTGYWGEMGGEEFRDWDTGIPTLDPGSAGPIMPHPEASIGGNDMTIAQAPKYISAPHPSNTIKDWRGIPDIDSPVVDGWIREYNQRRRLREGPQLPGFL